MRLYQGNINDHLRASFEAEKQDSGIIMHSKISGHRTQRDFHFPASPSLHKETQCATFKAILLSQRSSLQYLSIAIPERVLTCQRGISRVYSWNSDLLKLQGWKADVSRKQSQTPAGSWAHSGGTSCVGHVPCCIVQTLPQTTWQTLSKTSILPQLWTAMKEADATQPWESKEALNYKITFNTSDKDNMTMFLPVDYSCSKSFI